MQAGEKRAGDVMTPRTRRNASTRDPLRQWNQSVKRTFQNAQGNASVSSILSVTQYVCLALPKPLLYDLAWQSIHTAFRRAPTPPSLSPCLPL